MQVTRILSLLASAPPELISAVYELISAVLSSDDPERTAKRHAKMIAAREASRAALRKALP